MMSDLIRIGKEPRGRTAQLEINRNQFNMKSEIFYEIFYEIFSKTKNHALLKEKGVVSSVGVLVCVGVMRPHPFSEPW